MAFLLPLGLLGCAGSNSLWGPRCQVGDLNTVFSNALEYSGQTFCGEVMAFPDGLVVKMFPLSWPTNQQYDIVLLAEADSEELLRRGPVDRPFRVRVRGRLDVMAECFESSPGHRCLPFQRPIFIHLTDAVRRD